MPLEPKGLGEQQGLRSGPLVQTRPNVSLAIEDRAVCVAFLREFTTEYCEADPLIKTTRDVVSRVVKRLTSAEASVDWPMCRFVDLARVREWSETVRALSARLSSSSATRGTRRGRTSSLRSRSIESGLWPNQVGLLAE